MSSSEQTDRRTWMGVLARAEAAALAARIETLTEVPEPEVLRAPEIGAVMVRGRTGGTGAAFNLGEMTVCRCSLRLADGTVGHAYVQGRDKAQARQAALVDAMMQTNRAPQVYAAVIAPLAQIEQDRRTSRAAKAAATQVDFFTLVRGENA